MCAQAHVQPRHHLPRLPRAGREPARAAARRRAHDRLPRPQPRPRRPVRERGRHDAADDGQHDSLGQVPPHVRRADRHARAGAAAAGRAGRADRRLRRAGRLVRRADRPRLSRRDGVHRRQDLRQRGAEASGHRVLHEDARRPVVPARPHVRRQRPRVPRPLHLRRRRRDARHGVLQVAREAPRHAVLRADRQGAGRRGHQEAQPGQSRPRLEAQRSALAVHASGSRDRSCLARRGRDGR